MSTLLPAALSTALAASALCLSQAAFAASGESLMYVGTYTRGDSKGIYAYKFDSATGRATPLGLAAETPNPSFVAVHPNQRFLYAVAELPEGPGGGGAVSAYSIDKATGKLTFLNKQSSKGGGPCHLNVDRTGHSLIVVNYNTGSTTAMPVNPDGSLGEPTTSIQHQGSSLLKPRQAGPHAHSVNIPKSNKFAIVADLGLDRVLVYKFDAAQSTIAPNEPAYTAVKPGSGPRHFNFHPSQKYGYVINEIAATVTAFRYDAKKGALTEIQTISTLPGGENIPGNSTAEVLVHPSGKFLYGSNRGHNSIAMFRIGADGKLTSLGNESTQGEVPRNFAIDPSGKFLLAENQNSHSIVIFRIGADGKLTPTGEEIEQPSPVCIRFVAMK
ncbi:MAG: lactonase family protein [Bryobacteraceae bacterium]